MKRLSLLIAFLLIPALAIAGVTTKGVTQKGVTLGHSKAMILVFNIASDAETLTIPCQNSGTFNATINWGDNSTPSTITAYNDADLAHEYAVAGTYTVRISGTFPNIYFNDEGDKLKLLQVVQLGDTGLTLLDYSFRGCSNMTSFQCGDVCNTANVTDMRAMFHSCSSADIIDVSGFDTANVTDMRYMFNSCSSADIIDVSGFDTANVANMRYMFSGCSSVDIIDVSGFDTANVTDMRAMFHSCSSADIIDVSGFDTANVTDMASMFSLFFCGHYRCLDLIPPMWQICGICLCAVVLLDITGTDNWTIEAVADFTNFLLEASLSTANYDATLIA